MFLSVSFKHTLVYFAILFDMLALSATRCHGWMTGLLFFDAVVDHCVNSKIVVLSVFSSSSYFSTCLEVVRNYLEFESLEFVCPFLINYIKIVLFFVQPPIATENFPNMYKMICPVSNFHCKSFDFLTFEF